MRALLATRKGVFELTRQASGAWDLQLSGFIADPATMLLRDPRDGAEYVALNLGHFGVKMHRRDSATSPWQEIAVPVYPQQPPPSPAPDQAATPADSATPATESGATPTSADSAAAAQPAPEVEWKLKLIWSLAAGGADQPGVLWAGTLPGGLFRSEDRGESWQLVESLWNMPLRREWMGGGAEVPGIHSICVDPRNSARVLIGVSCGGAWLTEDGGASWVSRARGMRATFMPPELAEVENAQDPHLIVQCPSSPEHYWCQHHCGIWRSQDGAASWQQIEPKDAQGNPVSSFGFAVAVHPQDPNCAWFAPATSDERRVPVDAALFVSRTRDGGKTFEVLRNGLPQKNCYDLMFRHSLAVAADGKTLLMGSTTGGLWVSENAGDDWQEITHTLPPIYALGFA